MRQKVITILIFMKFTLFSQNFFKKLVAEILALINEINDYTYVPS